MLKDIYVHSQYKHFKLIIS